MKITGITTRRIKNDPNWIEGHIHCHGPHTFVFAAKVYDEGSEYGINEGRTSKLWIAKKINNFERVQIANYDRGWDHKPQPHHQHLVDALVALMEMQDPIPAPGR